MRILGTNPFPAGDVNRDGTVNIFDVNLVSSHWGEPGPYGDANADGDVDIFDINVISAHWGESIVPGEPVPEPATATMLSGVAGVLGFAAIRRRCRECLKERNRFGR